MYNVQIKQFQGPFEMLIELIEQKKLSINQVSLAQIADQYLDHIKELEKFPLNEVSSFVVVAATLMLIKSRSLMPSLELSREEESEIKDLEKQLKLYKQLRGISLEIEKILGKKVIFVPKESRVANWLESEVFMPPKDLSLAEIEGAVKTMLAEIPKKEILPEAVVKKTITLEEKMSSLIERLENKVSLCFSELKGSTECEKVDLIVNFLAILELVKRGFVLVKQEKSFGDIYIRGKIDV